MSYLCLWVNNFNSYDYCTNSLEVCVQFDRIKNFTAFIFGTAIFKLENIL